MQHWLVGFNVWINYREIDADAVEITDSMMELDLEEDEARLTEWKKKTTHKQTRKKDRRGSKGDRREGGR